MLQKWAWQIFHIIQGVFSNSVSNQDLIKIIYIKSMSNLDQIIKRESQCQWVIECCFCFFVITHMMHIN